MNRKRSSKKPPSRSTKNVKIDDDVVAILKQMQQKVMGSSALNGGFDTIITKMTLLQDDLNDTSTKVKDIHNAIYDPDEGLYARVKDVERLQHKVHDIDEVKKSVESIRQRHESEDRMIVKESKNVEEREKLFKEHNDKIRDLVDFKLKFSSILKWTIVTFSGALVTLLGKLLYDFISGRITIH